MAIESCGCPLRTISLSVAYVYLAISVLIALLPLAFSKQDTEPVFLSGYFGFLAFNVILTLFLLVGVYKKVRPMIVMWLVYDTLIASVLIFNFVSTIIEYLNLYSYEYHDLIDAPFIAGALVNIAILCLKMYGIGSVYYHYKELDRENSKLHDAHALDV